MKIKYVPKMLELLDADSLTTKRVKNDFNSLSNEIFFKKYSCSKRTYFKRVLKYGDPHMNSPLAKIGKLLLKFQK